MNYTIMALTTQNIFIGFVAVICCSLQCTEIFAANAFSYKVREFELSVDHFNYAANKTFKLRYLYNDSYTDHSNSSPLFFYTGNEGDIEQFAQNTGFVWELAAQFKACVVFAEHRYYGKSLPFGDNTFNNTANISFLTVEQALEDYARLIEFLKGEGMTPVIAFGGSYGGMLAAWLRIKFPHLVAGALAASAPIWQFNGLTSCDIYAKITTSVFTTSYSSNCSLNIRNSWSVFKNYSSTEEGKKELNTLFKFCTPLKKEEDVAEFMDYLEDVYSNLAMMNYPYATNFLAPLPAYPVRQFCLSLKDEQGGLELLKALQTAINIYSNYTGTTKCLNYKSAYDQLGSAPWDIQMCNEMVMPMCSNINETMFPNTEWNFKAYSDKCYNKFKILPRLNDMTLRYGGKNLNFASNIIFSNGLLDPWSGGGVLKSFNTKIVIIIIPEGAHHIDLRESNPSDPVSVREARKQEANIIGQWLDEFE